MINPDRSLVFANRMRNNARVVSLEIRKIAAMLEAGKPKNLDGMMETITFKTQSIKDCLTDRIKCDFGDEAEARIKEFNVFIAPISAEVSVNPKHGSKEHVKLVSIELQNILDYLDTYKKDIKANQRLPVSVQSAKPTHQKVEDVF